MSYEKTVVCPLFGEIFSANDGGIISNPMLSRLSEQEYLQGELTSEIRLVIYLMENVI